jgi:hypothetical protein
VGLSVTSPDVNLALSSYQVEFNITTDGTVGIGDTLNSVFGGPVHTAIISLPSTSSDSITGGMTQSITKGKSINVGTNYFVFAELTVSWVGFDTSLHPLNLTVPAGSFDINAPEPATFAMAAGVLALIAGARYRRKRSRA